MAKLFAPKRIYIVLGIFVVANVLATFKVATDKSFFNSSDFLAYSIGAKMVMDGQGHNLYNLKVQTTYWDGLLKRDTQYILPYLAPPATAVFYIPYLFLSPNIQIQVAMLVNFLLILTGALIVGKIAQNKKLALLSIFSSWFVWVCVWQIQPTALLFLVTALLYAALIKKNFALAGILCAFYIIKPQYLIIAPFIFLLTGKSATFIKAFLATLLVLLTVNVSIVGPHALFTDYPKLLIATDNPNYGNRWFEMYSVQQITYRVSRFLVDSKIPPIIVGALFYLWGLVKINKLVNSKKTVADLFPIVVIIAFLSAYHVLSQDMSIISIAVFILLNNSVNQKVTFLSWGLVGLQILGIATESAKSSNLYGLAYIIMTLLVLRSIDQKRIQVGTE